MEKPKRDYSRLSDDDLLKEAFAIGQSLAVTLRTPSQDPQEVGRLRAQAQALEEEKEALDKELKSRGLSTAGY
jgi:hypothetical protein